MRDYSPLYKQVGALFENGQLPQVMANLLKAGKLPLLFNILNTFNYLLDHNEREDGIARIYDHLHQTVECLPTLEQKIIFTAMASDAMNLNLKPYACDPEDYQLLWVKDYHSDEDREKYDAQYERFQNHPFFQQYRKNLAYAPRAALLATLENLWASDQKRAFLYVFDQMVLLQNRLQGRHDPKLNEEKFIESVAMHPGLQLVVLYVRRGALQGNAIDTSDQPAVRVVVSNKDISPFNDAAASTTDPDFWVLTAQRNFESLESYMGASLRERPESPGHGPYLYTTNDDVTYASSANVLAALHDYVKVPSNFEAPAQMRVRGQLDGIGNKLFNKVHAYRFLRAKGQPAWSAALTMANSHRNNEKQGDVRGAARELVIHGFSNSLFGLANGIRDTEVYEGIKEGMSELLFAMRGLMTTGETMGSALDWYENEFGFHTDATLLSLDDRKRLAFKDLSDLMIAAVTGHALDDYYLQMTENHRFVRNKAIIESLRDLPVIEIADLFIAANDVTNMMRLHAHINRYEDKETPLAVDMNRKMARAGFQLLPRLRYKAKPNDIYISALWDRAGTFWIRTDLMPQYKTADELVQAQDFNNSVLMLEMLNSLKPEPGSENALQAQQEKLQGFIEHVILTREVRKSLRDEGIPDELRDGFIDLATSLLPHLVPYIAAEENKSLDETGAEADKLARAFADVKSKPKPLFARLADAATRTVGLLPGLKRRGPDA